MKILLIDPDVVLASVYSQFLELQGHAVTVAAQAQQAVELADTTKPDLVILEIQLPGHNGVEFLHEFRSHVDWQSIPIIIQSLLSQSQLKKHAPAWRQFGIVEIHSKTMISLKDLGHSIQKVTSS